MQTALLASGREGDHPGTRPASGLPGVIEIPTDVLTDPRLDALDVRLYALLKAHAGGDGWTEGLDQVEIARRLGVRQRAVQNHQARLERLGLIRVERPSGYNRVNRYRVETGEPHGDAP